ncbi:Clp protease ClpP [Psychroflexus sp. ALD_RP9]|uniref:Clp protease ClpP n=1 Tax=Psychroflexus sp. ALD_RP9 TaxID=2777186 RepID=UPI001A8FBB4A|nr:Clp protease ClpP [Psychroflexus sp. ALD_RP9]QSS96592.1 ATP-dependent Clp protease proteolytic subunit [Psychroflexus sp. ALD_RP9]
MIFSTQENTLKAYGNIWPGDGVEFMYHFERLQRNFDEITIGLHTYGGSVIDGNLIYNAINKSKSKIILEVEGLAASMGAFLLMATPEVRIVENGYIMIHAPRSGGGGTAKDLKKQAKLLQMMQNNFVKKLVERTGLSKSKAESYMDGDNWLDADEAKSLGIVSEIIEARVEPKIKIDQPNALGAVEVYNAYAQLITKKSINQKSQINMKQMIITAFALSAVSADSSDTAVMEALQEKFNELETGKANAEASLAKAEQKLNDHKEGQVKTLVEAYAKQNKLDDDKKQVFMNIGKTSGLEALQAVLESTKPTQQSLGIGSMIQSAKPGDAARADWDWDKWQKEDPRGLEVLASKNPEAWEELFNQKYNK